MKFKNVVSYNIKKLVPILGLAGATMFMGGCEKDDNGPTRDVEIRFTQKETDDLFYDDENDVRHPSILAQEYVKDPTIRTIYLVPEGTWANMDRNGIKGMRTATLDLIMNYSPKFRGKGDFNFMVGEASKIPEDSLWYVSKGWTINKRLLEQAQQNQR